MKILVLNCGSSSIKYQIFNNQNSIFKGSIDKIGEDLSFETAFDDVFLAIKKENHTIDAVGHRVVHGGEYFFQPEIINKEVLEKIKKCIKLAPLHNPSNIKGIKLAQDYYKDIPHIAVFDTAFHSHMPRRSKIYGINQVLAEKYKIKRYGFHGTSHNYVTQKVAEYLKEDVQNLKMISCHLGNGASVCAIEYGQSVETSMGMTPLEGLVMGTRSGDLDPAIVLKLAKELGIDEAENLLNKESGLKGLCGTNDMRTIEEKAAKGDRDSILALNVFSHRVRKYIGAYTAVMNGVDVIVMTGGIGENSASIRQRILQRMNYMGLILDDDLNLSVDKDIVEITQGNSKVKVIVVKTNEELMIAEETKEVLKQEENSKEIPIAISARHIHLKEDTFKILFGDDSELTVYKEISQPGQYASDKKLNLIGPKGRIDGVRILGPFRPGNQVEISSTDEYTLGIDAPVRNSGQIKDSAPITLEGPCGTVQLKEGLIIAKRHIHMTNKDAEHFGVKDRDEVEVQVSGGERDLTFADVLVRVKDSYVLEMHIDTDEANAAGLSKGAKGVLHSTKGKAKVLRKQIK